MWMDIVDLGSKILCLLLDPVDLGSWNFADAQKSACDHERWIVIYFVLSGFHNSSHPTSTPLIWVYKYIHLPLPAKYYLLVRP